MPQQLDHLAFLKQVADFGHGVFTRTMFHADPLQRKALQNWCGTQLELVEIIPGTPRTVFLHVLTAAGMKHFKAKSSLTSCTTVHGLADLALLNAYLFELGTPFLLPPSPYRVWDINGVRVGQVSTRYGLPKNPESCDVLLVLPKSRAAIPEHHQSLPFYTPLSLQKADFP